MSQELPKHDRKPPDNESPIDGGFVGEFKEPEYQEVKHRAQTAKTLAIILVCVMAGSFLAHYIAVLWATERGLKEAMTSLDDVFGKWLPVISSLVSGAVTYYFARGQK